MICFMCQQNYNYRHSVISHVAGHAAGAVLHRDSLIGALESAGLLWIELIMVF